MKEKFISTAVIAGVILGMNQATNVQASDYKNHYMSSGITNALSRNIVSLDHNNNFYPNNKTTRAEFASMITKAMGLQETSEKRFSDVPTNHKHYAHIQAAVAAGIIAGYNDKEFKPDKYISREEMIIMIHRYLGKTNISLPVVQKEKFLDHKKFSYPDIVQGARNLGIVGGYTDNTFRATSPITRAESVAILIRTIERVEMKLLELNQVKEPANNQTPVVTETAEYIVETRQGAKSVFNNYTEAYQYFSKLTEDAFIKLKGKTIDSNLGIARTKAYTLAYKDGQKDSFTYFASDTELKVTNVTNDKVYFNISGIELYVSKEDVVLIPKIVEQQASYYIKQGDNKLYHRVFQNNSYHNYLYGNAPEFMMKDVPYRSFEGNFFEGKEVHQYFNYLPLRTPSEYTGAEFDRYIQAMSPSSPLIGYGQVFVDAANKYNINPLYLLANAIHESAWGTSTIAKDKKNLFGFKAVDSDPYGGAAAFQTLEEGIYYCAEYISTKYLTPGTWIYEGAVLGNKSVGMNIRYASDPFWGQKITGHMNRIDNYLGNKDLNKFLIGTIEDGTELFTQENNKMVKINNYKKLKIVAKKDLIQTAEGSFVQLYSDDPRYPYIYVRSNQFNEIKTY